MGLSLKIGKIQCVGLAGSRLESSVGAAQIAFTNISCSRLQCPEYALHSGALLDGNGIFRARPRLVAHERVSITQTKL